MNIKINLKYPSGYTAHLDETFENGTTKEDMAERFAEVLTKEYEKHNTKLDERKRRRYKFGQYKVVLNLLENKL